jgi:hypothetical protein
MVLLVACHLHTRRNTVPLGQTATATCGGGVLSNENRMTAHRGLLAIILRIGRRQPFLHDPAGMLRNFVR